MKLHVLLKGFCHSLSKDKEKIFTCYNGLCSNVTLKAKGTGLTLLQLSGTNLMLEVEWIIPVVKEKL